MKETSIGSVLTPDSRQNPETPNNLDNKNADKKIFMPKQFEFNTFIENLRSISRISGEFTLLWFFSNYFYNAGLASTSVSSSTVLSNTSSIFVYLVGLCLLDGIRFNIWKALMVLGSFFGIWIVAMADKQGGSDNG